MNEDAEFVEYYTNWKQKLSNTHYANILNAHDTSVGFKRWILTQIKQNWTNLSTVADNSLNDKQKQIQLNKNKNAFLQLIYDQTFNQMEFMFPALRLLYDIALNELRTETIVESICSVIKTIYETNRQSMSLETIVEHVMLCLMLPKIRELISR